MGAYNSRGQTGGPGFLVQALRKPDTIAFPPGFESSIQRPDDSAQHRLIGKHLIRRTAIEILMLNRSGRVE